MKKRIFNCGFKWALLVSVFALLASCASSAETKNDDPIMDELVAYCKYVNDSLPQNISDEVRLEKITISQKTRVLEYTYTLFNVDDKDGSFKKVFDTPEVKKQVIQELAASSDSLSVFVEGNITVRCKYYDKVKRLLTAFDIKPSELK